MMNDVEGLVMSERRRQGRLSIKDSLQYAVYLAQALKKVHDRGEVFGALEPRHIALTDSGAELLRNGTGGISPYSAPEQIRGDAPDTRSDIFSLGAVLYEMLSGRRAFAGESPEQWKREILEQEPPPLAGAPDGLTRLVARCLVKSPDQRWQRLHTILMELKLLIVSVRQADQEAHGKRDRLELTLRAEIGELERRFAAQLSAQETVTSELQRSVADLQRKSEQNEARGAETGEALAVVQGSMAEMERKLSAHTNSIESLESAVTQTGEVVEHVVEAFDSLQKSMLEQYVAKSAPLAHNA